MGPLYLLGLASQKAGWLTARQATVSQNIANAATPGFKARDVRPFSDVLENMPIQMSATNPGHLAIDAQSGAVIRSDNEKSWEVTLSGNSVNLEQEMIKSGEISRAYSMNAGIVKAFHHMLMMNAKS